MATFKVYVESDRDTESAVSAPTARIAAERFWQERVLDGEVMANREERVIVLHDDGPNVDPSATWITDEDGTFAWFDVSVASVMVNAVEAK
jgi:hypothetical protein